MSYIKYKIPDKVKTQIKRALTTIAETRDSKIRKGMNEVTKSIERRLSKLVILAEDVSPPEILFHVPLLCEENSIPYAYISSKKEIGNAVKMNVSSSAISIENEGSGNDKLFRDLIRQINELKK